MVLPALAAGLAAPLSLHAADQGEWVLSAFTGMAFTQNNDLHVREPGGTDLTLHDVSFSGHDFEPPPYYGARLTYWLPDQSHFGFALEGFHCKVYLNTGDTVHVTGTRNGVPVNDNEPVNHTLQLLEFHNGYNWATADAFYRFFLGHRGEDFLGRFQPYLGAGLGAVIPYVESRLPGGASEEGYELRGPGVTAIAGTNIDVTRHSALFVEYKFTYADLGDLDIAGGGIVNVNPMTQHLVMGVSFKF